MPTDAVKRDGFEFAYGHFRVLQRVERVEPSALRKMFLPKLTPEANRTLRKDDYFVHAQLKYYGVEYDPKELTGNGANLMKKMLSQGKVSGTNAYRSSVLYRDVISLVLYIHLLILFNWSKCL